MHGVCVHVCEFERTVCGSKSACVASCPPDLSAVSVAPPVATCARGHAVINQWLACCNVCIRSAWFRNARMNCVCNGVCLLCADTCDLIPRGASMAHQLSYRGRGDSGEVDACRQELWKPHGTTNGHVG
jgi:hypothetical protein